MKGNQRAHWTLIGWLIPGVASVCILDISAVEGVVWGLFELDALGHIESVKVFGSRFTFCGASHGVS